MNLRGKVALITGGKRVGSALATMLAGRGASVALTYHTSRQAIEKTVAAVEAQGTRGLAVGADLSKAGQAERAVARVFETFGHIDVLVNMASTYRLMPFDSLAPGDFDEMIATNLAAPYFTSIYAARAMLKNDAENGLKGKIVSVGDWATERPGRGVLPYIAAKGGLTAMTLALAKELAPHITVNLVQPSTIDPPPGTPEKAIQKTVDLTPLRRIGSPDDANRLILYLLEGTDYATGGVYRIDGGRYLGLDSQDL